MKQYQRILIAIDISNEAKQVLETAYPIIKSSEALASVIHVAEHPGAGYGPWGKAELQSNEHEIRKELFETLAEYVESAGLESSLITIEFGHPVEFILKTAEMERSDLIVVGSHGRHGIKLLLGSTANGVIHQAKCDVLAARIQEQPS